MKRKEGIMYRRTERSSKITIKSLFFAVIQNRNRRADRKGKRGKKEKLEDEAAQIIDREMNSENFL
jgi:hypothetical protein